MRRIWFAVACLWISIPVWAQSLPEAVQEHQRRKAESRFKNLRFENVGPVQMGGRVVDIEVDPRNPFRFLVAYASGGLWETRNNGTTFEPLTEALPTQVIGDLAMAPSNPDILYLGTGENNSSRSSYAGLGVFKSTDGGKSWQYMGLAETHRIGRIRVHPENPDIVWVAAIGKLYTNDEHRGVYKSTDGGRTWRKTLYVNPRTGAIDLILHPRNPNVLYAATWERERRAWNFVEGGAGSGLWMSTDGGESWTPLSHGLPRGEHVGRIGLTISPSHPEVLYAVIDNQAHRPQQPAPREPLLSAQKLATMTREAFLAVPVDTLEVFLRANDFPAEYTAARVRQLVQQGEISPRALYEYLGGDANRALFETPIIGAEVYRSDDGGRTWRKTHTGYLDGLFFTYGYYFGQIWIDPTNPDRIAIAGVPLIYSEDGGRTFRAVDRPNVHVDHHALWKNPAFPQHWINGNDGGVNVTYDGGRSWQVLNTIPVGQFYTVAVDNARPYNIYGGLQDNGVWYGPRSSIERVWEREDRDGWRRLLGGDGMYAEPDTTNNEIVYAGFQFGNYFRINRRTGERAAIRPRHKLGEAPLRYNWLTPVILSPHNQQIVYFGANRLFRSLNQGRTWTAISPDLTFGPREGDVPYGTITTIDESPLRFGLIWVGTDDGRIWVTRDGGASWHEVNAPRPRMRNALVPPRKWVTRVVASRYQEGTAYVTLTGYREDDFTPYVFKTTDYGQTWQDLSGGLPRRLALNVIREDPVNPNILYVGGEDGLYISLDQGRSWEPLMGGLPDVAVYDMKIQARDKDLVVATHGRSIYVLDLEEIQQLTDSVLARPIHAFAIEPITENPAWGRIPNWRDPIRPSVRLVWWLQEAGSDSTLITIRDAEDRPLQVLRESADRGFNVRTWDLRVDSTLARQAGKNWTAAQDGQIYLRAGRYRIEFRSGTHSITIPFEVRQAPRRGSARPSGDEPEEGY